MDSFCEFINEWKQLGPDYNWRTLHPVMIEIEDDRWMGGVEVTVVLLGFGFRARWNYRETDMTRELAQRIDDVKAEPDNAR